MQLAGRLGSLAALLFGGLVGVNLLTASDIQSLELALAGSSSLLSLGGGLLYLLGLDRWEGRRALLALRVGWLLLAVGLLLPTSLFLFQMAAILLSFPAALFTRSGGHDASLA